MRKLIVTTFLTLDGVMQAPGGPGEDDDGFAFGGWSVNYWDELMGQTMDEFMGKPFDLVLGRKTYDIFAAYWPHAPEEAGGKPLNDATKHVASRSRPALEWSKSILIEGDAAEGVAALKRDGREVSGHRHHLNPGLASVDGPGVGPAVVRAVPSRSERRSSSPTMGRFPCSP